ncbi:MAG: MFS transporter [Caulobacteraceae bacterium]|nr:MFS transporter [Caulobacteraceae bacterium]
MSQAQSTETPAAPLALGRPLTLIMAAATGVAVANIYYNQPMLGVIERDFPRSAATALIPTATQLGYALGLFLVTPLGDLMDRRRLIVGQFVILALALIAAAAAPSALILVIASFLLGACATVAQQIVPFAASLSAPEKRGGTVGVVMAGLLCGILFSRTLAGFVATHAGWRQMFWLSSPLALAAAGTMAVVLPRNHPHTGMRYGMALRSLAHLWRTEPVLRAATLTQACLFGAFTVFWTILALHLQQSRFHMGADVAGLFGVVGAVGVFAAPLAGRIVDRSGPRLVIGLGAILTVLSWLIFGLWDTIPGLILGVVLLDFGVQSAIVSNQHRVYALHPQARSRLNTVFMTGMFLGGSAASALAMTVWRFGGWSGVSALGAILATVALLIQFLPIRAKI